MTNHLYYGDNLYILRDEIASESVDLIYLDPPFNSKATYNVLFRSPEGRRSQAQIEAFVDAWHWGDDAESCFDEVMESGNTLTAEMLRAMRSFLGENDMMAYLAMMAARLIELHKVLKPTGSLYLHCDPTASHYLKILLDSVFSARNFRNEIAWCYRGAGYPKKDFGRRHDIIFRYSKADKYAFNLDDVREPYAQTTRERFKHYVGNVRGDRDYGVQQLHPKGRHPDDWWQIQPISPSSKERLGYPTQKPLALLERIIKASSNKGDVVLDPFCGCGTTIHAAEKLNRKWIGIDITHLAISLIERRLKDAFPKIQHQVHGTPKDFGGAEALAKRDKYQFEWWAVSLVDAQPWGGRKKGSDRGIDGVRYFRGKDNKTESALVSVKGGKNVGVAMIRDLIGVLKRAKAPIGLFVTLTKPTKDMIREAAAAGIYEAYGIKAPRVQILTIRELLDGKVPKIPLADPSTFRKAQREGGKQEDLL